jgi:ribonuclease Z
MVPDQSPLRAGADTVGGVERVDPPPRSSRELVVLGTASQVPTRDRNHLALYLRLDEHAVLVDPGEGTQRQMTLAHRSVPSLSAILVTHFHGDHCLGLPGVLQRRGLDAPTDPIDLYYPAAGDRELQHLLRATATDLDVPARLRPVEADGEVGYIGPFRLVARSLDHPVPAIGYRLEEPERLHLLPERLAAFSLHGAAVRAALDAGGAWAGERWVPIDELGEVRSGLRVAFVFDTRLCDAVYELADGVDLLVAEATFLEAEAHLAAEHGHLTASQAARVAAECGVQLLVLTHYSARYPDTAVIAAEAATVFSDVVAADDLDVIPLPRPRAGG